MSPYPDLSLFDGLSFFFTCLSRLNTGRLG